jgi:hypothetical protein
MVRCLPSVEARLLGTKSVCVKTDWNSLTQPDGTHDRSLEHTLATRVESHGSPALRDLAEGQSISWEARFNVAVFLCSLAARTPEVRQQLKVAGLNIGEKYLADHPDAEDAVRWEQRFHDDGTRGLETAFSVIASVQTSYLASMHWRVLRTSDASFATADHPIIYYDGSARRTVSSPLTPGNVDAVFVALTPRSLLVASWLHGADHGAVDVPQGLADWFNNTLLQQTDVHFIEPPDGLSTSSETPTARPDLDISADRDRLARAWRCVRYTADENQRHPIAMTRWDDDASGYAMYAVED